MKLKIVNLGKFIRSIVIILGLIIVVSLFINSTTLSNTEIKYKEIYVSNGDTLWSIAKEEKENNAYYENKDIRDIVTNIKNVNKLNGTNLKENQQLLIPKI